MILQMYVVIAKKHLHLDEKLTFNNHIQDKISKANKGIGILGKLPNLLFYALVCTMRIILIDKRIL